MAVFSVVLVCILALGSTGCGEVEGGGEEGRTFKGLGLLIGLAVATLGSEDAACVAGGVGASVGTFGFVPAVVAVLIGIVGGNCVLYLLGRGGTDWLDRVPVLQRALTPDRIQRATLAFQKHGGMLMVTSRILPGSRLPTYFAAGLLRYPWPKFIVILVLTGAVWAPVVVGLAYYFGDAVQRWLSAFGTWAAVVVTIGVAGLWLFLACKKWRKRER